jgi:hypothetical protein
MRDLKKVDEAWRWVDEAGNAVGGAVRASAVLRHFGFATPTGRHGGGLPSLQLVRGNPENDRLVVAKAFGAAWGGDFLLSKEPADCVKFYGSDAEVVDELLQSQPPGYATELLEAGKKEARARVDIAALAAIAGLEVFVSRGSAAFWTREYGEFDELPEKWSLLRKGDARMTREVRKGPHWVYKQRTKKYTEEIGTLAPEANIEDAYFRLGGVESSREREEKKAEQIAGRKREFTEKFQQAVRRRFPRIPDAAEQEVVQRARNAGRVGNADWLWFAPKDQVERRFDDAAELAVRAHARHNFTRYDQLADSLGREAARLSVADKIDDVLAAWRGESPDDSE